MEVVGLIQMDVLPIVGTPEEVTTGALGRCDGIGKEEVAEGVISKRDPARLNKDILCLRIRAAPTTMSPTELRPVEGPLKIHEVGMDLPSTERVVGDGVRITADPAGGGNGGADGLTAGQHSDDG